MSEIPVNLQFFFRFQMIVSGKHRRRRSHAVNQPDGHEHRNFYAVRQIHDIKIGQCIHRGLLRFRAAVLSEKGVNLKIRLIKSDINGPLKIA